MRGSLSANSVTLRSARVEEARTPTELAMRSKRTWGYDDDFMRAIADDMIARPAYIEQEHATIAERGAAIAGYAIVRVDENGAYLRDLFIDPPFMRQGIGATLFDEALGFARAGRRAAPAHQRSQRGRILPQARFASGCARAAGARFGANLPLMEMQL